MQTMHRRDLLRATGLGLLGASASGWFPLWAREQAAEPNRRRQCILLWMSGGPSQLDTFDMKPGHANGGEFHEIETSAPGLRFSEHLPRLAKQAQHLAVLRGLSTKEGDHARGTYLMRTGHQPGGPVRFPAIGSSLAKALGNEQADLPNYVSIAPFQLFSPAAFGPGFLGPRYAPLTVGATDNYQFVQTRQVDAGYTELGVDDLNRPASVEPKQADARLALWKSLEEGFVARHGGAAAQTHETAYLRAVRLMQSPAARAFDLASEPDSVREAYGKTRFGQGCLMARRLIEQGVPFVEVSLGAFSAGSFGWDTHQNVFPAVKNLSTELDQGWGMLLSDLAERGLLANTTLLWMGEFGRTPKINATAGRDHYPGAWTCVLAGAGIRGGQAHGRTSEDGSTVVEGQVGVGDVLATLATALGTDPKQQNISEIGRPIRLADGEPIRAVLA